jgi:hypothetical protein
VFEEERERLSASKQVAQKLDMDRFNLKKLSKMEVRERHQLNITNSSEVLESIDDKGHIQGAWENWCWREHKVIS